MDKHDTVMKNTIICEWCSYIDEDTGVLHEPHATIKLTLSSIDGEVYDTVCLCAECAGNPVSISNGIISMY